MRAGFLCLWDENACVTHTCRKHTVHQRGSPRRLGAPHGRSVCCPAHMRGTVSSASEGSLVCLLPLTMGARQQGAHPFLAFQHRTISAVVLSSRLVVWGTSGQVI